MDAHVCSFDSSIYLHLSRGLWDYQALTYARVYCNPTASASRQMLNICNLLNNDARTEQVMWQRTEVASSSAEACSNHSG